MKERRDFLKKLTGLTATLILPLPGCDPKNEVISDRLGEILPKRLLGKTGEEVTMLGLGGYHIGWTTEKDAQETIEAALAGGIRFFDNAESYGPHTSEERYGKYLTPKYRDLVFLMTKTLSYDAKTAREHLEASLKRLKTDYLDLWQVHSLFNPEDVDTRIANGVLEVMREAKESGKVKHIGFTGHQNPQAHALMLANIKEDDLFETIQMPINPVDAAYHSSFIKDVLPEAVERKYGILAMKTLADGRFFSSKKMIEDEVWSTEDPVVPGRVTLSDALYFAWSLPISVLITGAENKYLVEEKITMAKQFSTLSDERREELIAKVADLSTEGSIEYYKNV